MRSEHEAVSWPGRADLTEVYDALTAAITAIEERGVAQKTAALDAVGGGQVADTTFFDQAEAAAMVRAAILLNELIGTQRLDTTTFVELNHEVFNEIRADRGQRLLSEDEFAPLYTAALAGAGEVVRLFGESPRAAETGGRPRVTDLPSDFGRFSSVDGRALYIAADAKQAESGTDVVVLESPGQFSVMAATRGLVAAYFGLEKPPNILARDDTQLISDPFETPAEFAARVQGRVIAICEGIQKLSVRDEDRWRERLHRLHLGD